MLRALELNTSVLVANSLRTKPQAILTKILSATNDSVGFDAESCEVRDLIEAGVLDPAKTLHTALQMAFLYAKEMVLTGAWEIKEIKTDTTLPTM